MQSGVGAPALGRTVPGPALPGRPRSGRAALRRAAVMALAGWCLRRAAFLLITFATMPTAQADALHTLEVLRVGGCGGTQPAAPALVHVRTLDRAAASWAAGRTLGAAAAVSGYDGAISTGWHVQGGEPTLLETLKRSGCPALAARSLRDVGLFQRAHDLWVVTGARVAPPVEDSSKLEQRVLELVNAARTRGAHCGKRSFGPAPPVMMSGTLDSVALGHAIDMAQHGYFEHEDLSGHTPADRVRAVGYREKLVGENIAYGPVSADDVVQGWLDSPDHCENIMDPRFAQMGIAYAPGHTARRGLYWVQLLAAPRA